MNDNVAINTNLTKGSNSVVFEIISLSKLNERIDALSSNIEGVIDNDRNSMPITIFNRYKKIVVSSFESSPMKQDVNAMLSEKYDDGMYRRILTFLRNPEILNMDQQENTAKTPDALQEMQAFFTGLESKPPTEARKLLIEQLDNMKKASLIFIDSQVELFRAITFGMRDISEGDQKTTDNQLNRLVLDMRNQATPHMQRHVWTGMLYAFRNKTDSELSESILLYGSIEGKFTTELLQSVFQRMFRQMTGRLQYALESEFSVNKINA